MRSQVIWMKEKKREVLDIRESNSSPLALFCLFLSPCCFPSLLFSGRLYFAMISSSLSSFLSYPFFWLPFFQFFSGIRKLSKKNEKHWFLEINWNEHTYTNLNNFNFWNKVVNLKSGKFYRALFFLIFEALYSLYFNKYFAEKHWSLSFNNRKNRKPTKN